MTEAETTYLAERLDAIELLAGHGTRGAAAVSAESTQRIKAEFHRWKNERDEFPTREDLFVLIAVIAAYLKDGM